MSDCLFCNIIAGDVPSTKVYEDDQVFAFEDISPRAPTHVLVVPKKHIPTVNDLRPADSELVGHMVGTATLIARRRGIDQAGYRVAFNVNQQGGQVIYHIHLHVLGGKQLGPPA